MQSVDYFVIVIYLVGIVAAGMVFAGRMKSSSDMFAAGGLSPWWVSGLSGFMTMFSAGTFVVWGGHRLPLRFRRRRHQHVLRRGGFVCWLVCGRKVASDGRQFRR